MLPQGFTRVEWIESTGTQYIDTGITIDKNNVSTFKVIADVSILQLADWTMSGANGPYLYFGIVSNGNIGYGTGNSWGTSGIAADSERHTWVIDAPLGIFAVPDKNIEILGIKYESALLDANNFIISGYSSGESRVCHPERIWQYRFFQEGNNIRNYVPCIDENGDANLWDDVNGTLAEKVGTFLYGAPVVPESLSGLVQINAQAGAAFSWNPSEDANEYVIERDGVKIATVYGNVTSYTDADAPGKSTYTVTPYNGTQAGTGASITILTKLDTPVNLKASLDDRAVALTWDAVSNAEGYRVYRDGEAVASVTSTTYTDTFTPPASVAYAVSAYVGTIQSEISQTVVVENWEGVLLALITDRTAADVAEAKRLRDKLFAGEVLTDEEFARYSAGLRGCYNASDMSRVGAAVRYVAGRLNAEGYGAHVSPKTYWQMEYAVRQSDWNKYLDEVRHLRRKLTLMRTTPQITDGMYSGLKSYADANAIEQILVDLDWMLTNIIRDYIYAGEVFAGEV